MNESPRHPDGAYDQFKFLGQPLSRSDFLKPRSPPPTPSPKGTKNLTQSPKAATAGQSPHFRQTFSREVTLSPSPMYTRLPLGAMPLHETWQQDFQNFHLGVPDDGLPLSPPHSGRALQHGNAMGINVVDVAQNGGHMQTSDLVASSHNMKQPTPSIGPLDPKLYVPRANPTFLATGPTLLSSSTDQNLLASHHSHQPRAQTMPSWDPETIDTTRGPSYGYVPSSGIGKQGHSQEWWSPPPTTSDQSATSGFMQRQEDHHPRIVAPSPQRPVHQLVSSASHHVQAEGLMIHYASDDGHASKPDYRRPTPVLSTVMTATSFSPASAYPPLPDLKSDSYQQAFSPTSPFTMDRRRSQASPARSVSASPTNTTRSTRQTTPARSCRRKSMGNPKASGVSKAPRTPKTPKTPNGACEMDFINLTAADSVKLLSDVAPSGSSKTRARREQEAREKRRRVSEAAARLVRKAGGDIKALEKAIST